MEDEQDYDYRIGEHVATVDGYPGVVTEILDGPYPGTEKFIVRLDNNLGGGEYSANELGPTDGTTSEAKAGPRILHSAARDGSIPLLDFDAALAAGYNLASLDYPELSEILWERPDHVEIDKTARKTAKPIDRPWDEDKPDPIGDSLTDEEQPWWWRKVVGPAVDRVNKNLPPAYQTTDLHAMPAIQWCRFRRDGYCYFPDDLDEKGTLEAGYTIWVPINQGTCPRVTHDAQRQCPVGEPGPDSGERVTYPDATYHWDEGGQRKGRSYSTAGEPTPVFLTAKTAASKKFWVRLGDDGARLLETDDYDEAHRFALEESARNWAGKAQMFGPSGKIGEYREGAMTGHLGGDGQWKTSKRYSDTPLVCDGCGGAASVSTAGGREGHSMFCPDCKSARDEAKTAVANYVIEAAADEMSGTILAKVGEREVGKLLYGFGPPPYVLNVAVEPEYQRTGVATALWETARSYAPTLRHSTHQTDEGKEWAEKVGTLKQAESAWSDIVAKARDIRSDGGVRVIAVTDNTIAAEVRGDHSIYQSIITREPGTKRVGMWECSCPWNTYAWARSAPWKQYEGRMCAHVLALRYEAQSQEMFGGELHEQPEEPAWRTHEPTFHKPLSSMAGFIVMAQNIIGVLDGFEGASSFEGSAALTKARTSLHLAVNVGEAREGRVLTDVMVKVRDRIVGLIELLGNGLAIVEGVGEVQVRDIEYPTTGSLQQGLSYRGSLHTAAGDHDGCMIALVPTIDMRTYIQTIGLGHADLDLEPVEGIHLTVAYAGDTDAIDRDTFHKVCKDVAKVTDPLVGKVGGAGVFANDDGNVLWVSPDVPMLDELRVAVTAALLDAGITIPTDHGFTPHMTVGYSTEPLGVNTNELGEVGIHQAELSFGTLVAAYGGEWTHYDLVGSSAGVVSTERQARVAAQHDGDERAYKSYVMRYVTSDQGERRPRHIIETFDGSTKIGELNWYGTTGSIHHIDVESEYARQGIATAMWEWGKEMRPRPRHTPSNQTTQGKEWAKSVGASRAGLYDFEAEMAAHVATGRTPDGVNIPDGSRQCPECNGWGELLPDEVPEGAKPGEGAAFCERCDGQGYVRERQAVVRATDPEPALPVAYGEEEGGDEESYEGSMDDEVTFDEEELEQPEAAPSEEDGSDLVPGDPRLAWVMGDAGASSDPSGGPDIADAAEEFLKQSLKAFTPDEKASIIDEGGDIGASNLGGLDLSGTHYTMLDDDDTLFY